MTVTTLSTTITTQLTPGTGNYGTNLTIETSGAVLIPIQGGKELQKAIYMPTSNVRNTIINYGTISSQTSFEPDGGIGIWSSEGAIVNNFGVLDGTYIADLMVEGGTVNNFGNVSSSGFAVLLLNGGSVSNSGTLKSAMYGAVLHDASMVNTGTVLTTDVGVSIYNQGQLTNFGSIISGTTGVKITASGDLSDTGLISGKTYAILASGSLDLVLYPEAVINGAVDDMSNNGQLALCGTLHGDLKMAGSFSGFDEYTFSNDSTWTLEGTIRELASGETLNGFTAGDTIVLEDFSATSSSYISGVGIILQGVSTNETILIEGTMASSQDVVSAAHDNTYIIAPCFRSGTSITTISGKVAIDELKVGDVVKSLHGKWSPIKWIGKRTYDGRFASKNDFVLPVCIKRHALAENVPSKDLFLSPDHAVCEGGMLINAWRLVNGVSVIQLSDVKEIVYFHIELDFHDIIFAEDCPTESFLDADCRDRFENSQEFYKLYPSYSTIQQSCLPRLDHGMHLYIIQSRIKVRAGIDIGQGKIGALRGFVDEAGPRVIRGWAQDISKPEEPVVLSIVCFGEAKALILANQYRPDLRKAGLGSGCHGFEYFLESDVTSEYIEVFRIQDRALVQPYRKIMPSSKLKA